MPAPATTQAYSRDEVRRLLGVSNRQLQSWEQQNFLSAGASFTFSDILALRTLVGLRKNKVPAAQIRKAVAAVRARLRDVENPLTELKIFARGKKIQVQFAGQKMEPISGQLLLDFDEAEISKLLSFPGQAAEAETPKPHKARRDAEIWFEKGLDLEQTGAPVEDVIAAYHKAAEIDPSSAGALVNLGTVYFNARDWREAERYYRKAVEVDPEYALAHFNLGNLYDERGNRQQALIALSGGAPHSAQLRRRALQRRAALPVRRPAAQGGPPLEVVSEARSQQRLGRHRAPRTGQAQGIDHCARPERLSRDREGAFTSTSPRTNPAPASPPSSTCPALRTNGSRPGTIRSSFRQCIRAMASRFSSSTDVIVSADDQQRRRLHALQRRARQIRPPSARNHGVDQMREFRGRNQRRACARAGPEVSHLQTGDLRMLLQPLA